MSWIFGYKNPGNAGATNGGEDGAGDYNSSSSSNQQPPSSQPPPPPPLTNAEKKQMEAYRFDSSSLERAAQAARELERSKYSREALELLKIQESNKKVEHQAKIKEYELQIAQTKIQEKRVESEEARKRAVEETKLKQQQDNYRDQLARKRYEDQLQQQKINNEEILRRQEESLEKQEAMRLRTTERELKYKEELEMKRIDAEMKAKAKYDRENRDLILEQIKIKAEQKRIGLIDSINATGSILGSAANALLTNWDKTLMFAGNVSLVALGIYSSKTLASVGKRYLVSRLDTPSLIRETSRFSFFDAVRSPARYIKSLFRRTNNVFAGMILEPKLETRVLDIAIRTKNIRHNNGKYMNLLLYGPPGTGKTMFAKLLAQNSNMDYGIMTGGDVAPLGIHSVTALHRVFDWAERNRKGFILFIDEADGFLRNRLDPNLSENLRTALAAFLARTGSANDKIMLVLTTNIPHELDPAIHDRIDEIVEFSLPGLKERERMIARYFDDLILTPAAERKSNIKVDKFDYAKMCNELAEITEGLSGREISKMVQACLMAAYLSKDCHLTHDLIMEHCRNMAHKHRQAVKWRTEGDENADDSGKKTAWP